MTAGEGAPQPSGEVAHAAHAAGAGRNGNTVSMPARNPVFLQFGPSPGEAGQLVRPGARESYPPEVLRRLDADAETIIARYPQSRSALLPLLHLVQSEDGYISPAGVEFCASRLGLTGAEVSAVATFYSMYRREETGDYLVGVCTNTLCAVMGGDTILRELAGHLGIEPGGTTDDGKVTLEHVECNAACDYAPVLMVNWEFFDNQTPESARTLVDSLRSGSQVTPSRGAPLCTFRETARILAGFADSRPGALDGEPGAATLAGLHAARAAQPDLAPTRPAPVTTAQTRRAPSATAPRDSAVDPGVITGETRPRATDQEEN